NATDNWTRPLAWMDHALARLAERERADPGAKDEVRQARHSCLNTRGALLYRTGRFEEAAKVLREGMALHRNGGAFRDWLFLALAELRLDHAEAAQEAAARVRAAPRPDTPWEQAEVDLLAAELDAAVPPPGK